MIPIFPCDSRRSRGVPSGSGVFLRLLVGEMWTCKLAPIFAYGKWLYHYTARQIWTKDVWIRAILRTDILFHHMSSSLPQKSTRTSFWGPFNAKPIIDRALRKSHVNGAAKLKLYSYIGIGKYLRVWRYFSARGRPGDTVPPYVNLGPAKYLGNY